MKGEVLATPRLDVLEGPNDFVIVFEVPDVPRNAVSLGVVAGRLELDAVQSLGEREAKCFVPRRFRASVSLPESTDFGVVDASLDAGLLRVRVAKSERGRTRQIPISAAS